MTPSTARKVALTLAAARAMRRAGIIGERENLSTHALAAISMVIDEPVSEKTFRRIEHDGLAKARLALTALRASSLQTEN